MIAAFVLFTAAFADSVAENAQHGLIRRDWKRKAVRKRVGAKDSVPARLVVEEGKYGEVLIPMRSIQNAKLRVSLPQNAKLTWEPGALQDRDVSLTDGKKLYELSVLNDGRDDVLLRVSGSPTEGAMEVTSAGHTIHAASLVVEQRQPPTEGATQAKIKNIMYKQSRNIRTSNTVNGVAKILGLASQRQQACEAGGRCYGISTMWIKDKVKPRTISLEDADHQFFSKLNKLRREWTDAAIVQSNQKALKNALIQKSQKGKSENLNVYDHPYYVRTRLDPHEPGNAKMEISTSHLVNWMTRNGHSEFAYMTIPGHAMALAYHHSADTNSGSHSFSFFDPNVGTRTFSHEDIEIMKNAVIRYFENELVKVFHDTGLAKDDKVVVTVQKVPRDKFINIVNDVVVKYSSNNPCARRLRLLGGRYLQACRESALDREEDELIMGNEENNAEVVTYGPDGSRSTKNVAREDHASAASESPKSILTVSLEAQKLVPRLHETVKSMRKSDIAKAFGASQFSEELRPILETVQNRFKGRAPRPAEGTHPSLPNFDATPTVNTLNSGMFVLALSHILEGMPSRGLDPHAWSNVQYALGLQMYVNLVGSGLFVAADLAKFGFLATKGAAITLGEEGVQNMISRITRVESSAGGILSVVNVGFDVYNLWEAGNEIERSKAINNIVFDSVGVALQGTTLVLAASGAAAAAEVFGAFLTPLAGLQIGVTALVDGFATIGLEAKRVGQYFSKLREGFTQAYKLENGNYVPNPYSVIEEINFQNQNVKIGSPYLSKSKHGPTGSGKINYFFWIGDLPECKLKRLGGTGWLDLKKEWRKDVFDIWEKLKKNGHCGDCETRQQLKNASSSTFYLPISPQSVIGYTYFTLPGATTRHDDGFSLLRDLEGDDFDFDFYIFPSEYLINKMRQYFLDTEVKVVMDDTHRVLITPLHEKGKTNAWNKLSYHIVGSTEVTEIYLRSGVRFNLTARDASTAVRFVLDSTLMDQNAQPTVEEKKIQFDELSIDYSTLPQSSIVYLRSERDVKILNIELGTLEIEGVEFPPKLDLSVSDVLSQLSNLTREHHTAGRFVAVRGNVQGVEGHIDYDTHESILVYTNDPTPADTILLGVQSKTFGCFASPKQCRVWCTDLETHQAVVETKSFCSKGLDVAIGSFAFVAKNTAILEIQKSVTVQSEINKATALHYRYLLSKHDCLLVDIRCFASIDSNFPQDIRYALKEAPQDSGATEQIGNGAHPKVSAREAKWVAYEHFLHSANLESRKPELHQRSWYHNVTDTTITLNKSTTNILLRNLTFMPLVRQTPSSRQKQQPDVLFHDSSSAQVFRYERTSKPDDSEKLALFRAEVVSVAQSGTAWFGISSYGSVVELSSAQSFEIIGYTYDAFENLEDWSVWWNELPDPEKSSAPIIPFYQVELGIIKATRTWYVRQDNAYVILDDQLHAHSSFNCVGVAENKHDAILVGKSGKMWTTRILKLKDPPNKLGNQKKPPIEPWMPAQHVLKQEQIVGAQWDAAGVTINTKTGLVILASNLTTNSATFTLCRLRVPAVRNDALPLYQRAQTLLQMPKANYLAVGLDSTQGYLINVTHPNHVKFLVPDHNGVPLGVDNIENQMLFFDAATKTLWSDNTERDSTFDSVVRFGEVLLATSSDEQVFIPKLFGVNKLAVKLTPTVQQVIVPDTYAEMNEVLIDTTTMTQANVVRVHVPWKADKHAQSVLRDVGNKDPVLQIVLTYASQKTLRWQGLYGQKLNITFASSGKGATRSAAAEAVHSDSEVKVLIASCVAAVAAIASGIYACRRTKIKYRQKQEPQE